jgi:hypothetical protein
MSEFRDFGWDDCRGCDRLPKLGQPIGVIRHGDFTRSRVGENGSPRDQLAAVTLETTIHQSGQVGQTGRHTNVLSCAKA